MFAIAAFEAGWSPDRIELEESIDAVLEHGRLQDPDQGGEWNRPGR
jgi:hypothetical protein